MDNKLPITRLSKFLSQDDFDLNIQIGQEYLHGDLNMKLVLYRVDRQRTNNDDVYGEALSDGIQFLAPIEVKGLVKIQIFFLSYETSKLFYYTPNFIFKKNTN